METPAPSNVIRLFIPGIPRPGGSKTATLIRRKDGSPVMVPTAGGKTRPLITVRDDAKGNADWKATVKFGASQSGLFGDGPLTGALRVSFTFYMPRPKNHYRGGDLDKGLKPNSIEIQHTKKPDALKLARSTEDALTGVAWIDDCQTFEVVSRKKYVRAGEQPGVLIEICGPLGEVTA